MLALSFGTPRLNQLRSRGIKDLVNDDAFTELRIWTRHMQILIAQNPRPIVEPHDIIQLPRQYISIFKFELDESSWPSIRVMPFNQKVGDFDETLPRIESKSASVRLRS